MVATHCVLWLVALGVALAARFDGSIPFAYLVIGLTVAPLLLLIRALTFWRSGLYHGLLRYAGVAELRSIIYATTFGTVVLAAAALLHRGLALPRSIYFLEWTNSVLLAGGLRLAIRLVRQGQIARPANAGPPAVLLGGGSAADLLLRDLQRTPGAPRVALILDDDDSKWGSLLHAVRITGPIDRPTLEAVTRQTGAKIVILAMPTASGVRTREIAALCRELGLSLKTIPGIDQLMSDHVRVSLLRDVAIEDLLRRPTVELDMAAISRVIRGRRVLVTGAAGSIGSEIARQIAHFNPEALYLVDHNENGLFFLERELQTTHPSMTLLPRLGNIRDRVRMDQVFAEARPAIVFHAAAHKHVPLMEQNPGEAVRNNVIGTQTLAEVAGASGCERFVLISTDKAVNPTSVMGSTKRIAEMLVQSLKDRYPTKYVAVRFGNVLGSAGSVVPIFRQQIADGGPVTVTDPEMRRYFMTIPEATQLVLQASALGTGGEIFVLDMGEPVKIVDLARDMITLSGFQPDVDIKIEFTGLRPGEKLYEELLLDEEAATATRHPKIRIARIREQSHQRIVQQIARLERLASEGSPEQIRSALAVLVPEATLTRSKNISADSLDLGAAIRELAAGG